MSVHQLRNPVLILLSALCLLGCSGASDRRGGGGIAGIGGWGGGSGSGIGGLGGFGGFFVVPVEGDGCGTISQPAAQRLQGADIIFAIDNSGSMDEEIVFVREQMNAFSQQIVSRGVDVRIIMISAGSDEDNGICISPPLGSGQCPNDTNLPRYFRVDEEVGSSDALNLFVETFPRWREHLRPNATKTFVVVTDDDATDRPIRSAAAFTSAVQGLDPTLFQHWTFSGIYCFSECPDAAEIGEVYIDLVAQTGGVAGDLCLQDFAPVFARLAEAVIAGVDVECAWQIPAAPPGEEIDPRQIEVRLTSSLGPTPQPVAYVGSAQQCTPSGGWYYDDPSAPTRVFACPSTCNTLTDDPNAQLDAVFGCLVLGSPE